MESRSDWFSAALKINAYNRALVGSVAAEDDILTTWASDPRRGQTQLRRYVEGYLTSFVEIFAPDFDDISDEFVRNATREFFEQRETKRIDKLLSDAKPLRGPAEYEMLMRWIDRTEPVNGNADRIKVANGLLQAYDHKISTRATKSRKHG